MYIVWKFDEWSGKEWLICMGRSGIEMWLLSSTVPSLDLSDDNFSAYFHFWTFQLCVGTSLYFWCLFHISVCCLGGMMESQIIAPLIPLHPHNMYCFHRVMDMFLPLPFCFLSPTGVSSVLLICLTLLSSSLQLPFSKWACFFFLYSNGKFATLSLFQLENTFSQLWSLNSVKYYKYKTLRLFFMYSFQVDYMFRIWRNTLPVK